MKKILLPIAFFSFVFTCHSQIRVGGFAGYRTNVNSAFGLTAEFMLNEHLGLSVTAARYPTETFSWGECIKRDYSLDFHYYFTKRYALSPYVVVGMYYLQSTNSLYRFDNERTSEELGTNLGMGFNVNLKKRIIPFSEVKYLYTVDYKTNGNVMALAGIKFNLKK